MLSVVLAQENARELLELAGCVQGEPAEASWQPYKCYQHPPVPEIVGNHFSSMFFFYLGMLGGVRS